MLPFRLKRRWCVRVWPQHRRLDPIASLLRPRVAKNVDFAHLRSAANAGIAQTPHDMFGVSLCRAHHGEQHSIGTSAFNRKYGIDLWALATEFAYRSPDWEMRASLRIVPASAAGTRIPQAKQPD